MDNTHKVAGVQVSVSVNKYVWKQTYLDKTSRKLVTEELSMLTMSEEHIKKAYSKCQSKVNELQQQIDTWIDIMDKFEEVCKQRNILKGLEYEENYILKNDKVIPQD